MSNEKPSQLARKKDGGSQHQMVQGLLRAVQTRAECADSASSSEHSFSTLRMGRDRPSVGKCDLAVSGGESFFRSGDLLFTISDLSDLYQGIRWDRFTLVRGRAAAAAVVIGLHLTRFPPASPVLVLGAEVTLGA
jgi:hypothetical protein